MKIDKSKLQEAINRKNMTVFEFARYAGVPQSAVHKALEKGRAQPQILRKISSALRFPLGDLASEVVR